MGSHLQGQLSRIGPYRFKAEQYPLIMGIVNLTPDSFSDGGEIRSVKQACARAKALVSEGAHILDLGAESTRPGAQPVTAAEEKRRLLPVIKQLKKLAVPLSVDTCKAEVAQAALQAGAHMLNDVTGLREPAMREVAARWKVPVIIMHMRGKPQTMQKAPRYGNVVEEVRSELLALARRAERAGVPSHRIILDPGIGFGKTAKHNIALLKRLDYFVNTRYPVLLGPSRKSYISAILGAMEPKERIWGTAATIALGVAQGVQMIRVHDVAQMRMVAKVAKATVPVRLSLRKQRV